MRVRLTIVRNGQSFGQCFMHRYAKIDCDDTDLLQVFRRARNGSSEALGELFDGCRLYLLLVANEQLGSDLAAKTGGSDLVQETFVRAQQRFVSFDGATEVQLLAWLRKILLNHVISLQRRYLVAEKRRVSREVSLDDSACRRFAAHRAIVAENLGLASQAITCHRFAVTKMWEIVSPIPLRQAREKTGRLSGFQNTFLARDHYRD